jgi:hypothetical protein
MFKHARSFMKLRSKSRERQDHPNSKGTSVPYIPPLPSAPGIAMVHTSGQEMESSNTPARPRRTKIITREDVAIIDEATRMTIDAEVMAMHSYARNSIGSHNSSSSFVSTSCSTDNRAQRKGESEVHFAEGGALYPTPLAPPPTHYRRRRRKTSVTERCYA